ncbi:MAG: hypothetical protein IJ509_01900 [Bacilli bacterium]|nr:hypothetical protein [Bacilli bacterium]
MILFILLSIILFFFCLYLYQTNKNLKQQVNKLELETKEILERKIMKSIATDLVSIEILSKEKISKPLEVTPSKSSLSPKVNYPSNQRPQPTISTPKLETVKPITTEKIITDNPINQGFDLSDFIPREKRKVSNLKEKPITNPARTNHPSVSANEYLKEISDQIAAQLEPKTIELTDYEKNEEEQAIISYQELISLKGQLPKEEQPEDRQEYINLLD